MKSERCTPDYEAMIARAKDRLRKNDAFRFAIFDYTENQSPSDKVAELVGELVFESRQLNASIEGYIKAQEEEERK